MTIEDQVREALRHRADAVTPPRSRWPELEDAEAKERPSPPVRSRVAAAAVALAVFVPVVILAFAALRPSTPETGGSASGSSGTVGGAPQIVVTGPRIGITRSVTATGTPWELVLYEARIEEQDGSVIEPAWCLDLDGMDPDSSLPPSQESSICSGEPPQDPFGGIMHQPNVLAGGQGFLFGALSSDVEVVEISSEHIPEPMSVEIVDAPTDFGFPLSVFHAALPADEPVTVTAFDSAGIVLQRQTIGGDEPPSDGGTPPTEAIEVTSPLPGSQVTSPVTISGTADVFEGTVRIRVFDAVNNMIVDTFTTAMCGSGCRGEFSAEIEFAVAEQQPGEIVVFEESAETGKPTNVVRIPVTLVPGENLERAMAFIGTWTDAAGNPVPEDEVTASLGPEHCSWGDIVFLRLGDPPYATGPMTFVRDTTDELMTVVRPWRSLSELPDGLEPSGWRIEEWELWLDPSDVWSAYLHHRTTGATERWPTLRAEVGCD